MFILVVILAIILAALVIFLGGAIATLRMNVSSHLELHQEQGELLNRETAFRIHSEYDAQSWKEYALRIAGELHAAHTCLEMVLDETIANSKTLSITNEAAYEGVS